MLPGYRPHASRAARRSALTRLIKSGALKANTVYKYLLSYKNIYSPGSSYVRIARGDARWIRQKYYGTRYW